MENKNGIGRLGLTALIVSSCIGTGIFGITNTVAAARLTIVGFCRYRLFATGIVVK